MSPSSFFACCLLGALGCGRTASELYIRGCTTDLECKGTRICVNGTCEERPIRDPAGSGGSSSGAGSSSGGTAAGAGAVGGTAGTSTAGGASDGAGGGAGSITVGRVPVRLDVGANALIADPMRGKLYAVTRSDAEAHANELVVIDAEHASIEASVAIGIEPDVLAISDDATRLWVGLRGVGYQPPGHIREVDLTKWPPEPGREFAVPPLSFHSEGVHATSMVVLPGLPASVALSLDCVGCGLEEVVILDSGNLRPNRTSDRSASRLALGPPGYLFGFNDSDTGHDFSTIAIDDTGATQAVHRGLIDGFANRIIYVDDYVVASSGHVVDVSSVESPFRAGTFAYEGEVVPHSGRGEVVMLSYAKRESFRDTRTDTNAIVVRRLNLSTFRADLETPLDGLYAGVHDFVEVKPGLFAFINLRGADNNSLNPLRASVCLFAAPDVEP